LPSDACITNCGSVPSEEGNEKSSESVEAAPTAVTARRETARAKGKTKNNHFGIHVFLMESSLSVDCVLYIHSGLERGEELPFAGTALKRNGG
jgi:hypothetical protein